MIDRPILHGALFVSLALNVFIGGAFVGAQLQKDRQPPAHAAAGAAAPGQRNPLAAAIRALPEEHRQAWRDQNPDFAQAYGPKTREARRLARQAMQGLGAETLDTQATLSELEQARSLEKEVRVAMDRRIVTFAATLPREQRAALGEALAKPRLGGSRAGQAGGGRDALPNR